MNILFDGKSNPWLASPLNSIPRDKEIAQLAAAVRRASGEAPTGAVDFRALCRLARARTIQAHLGGASGGLEAMLTPLPGDRFGISVDPTPGGGWRKVPAHLRKELRRHRFRFRVGHELGHTFFYARGGDMPLRFLFDSPAQEEFCDTFSRELLLPSHAARRAAPSPAGLLRLRAAHDVSLELAARALSAAQPDLAVGIWFAEDNDQPLTAQWSSPGAPVDPPEQSARGTKWLGPRRQLVHVA